MRDYIRIALAITLAAFIHSAAASYVESCALDGIVTSPPTTMRLYVLDDEGKELEHTETQFAYRVTRSVINGRADSGCTHFVGQTLLVQLSASAPRFNILIGRKLSLSYFAKKGRGQPTLIFFALMPKATTTQPKQSQ